MLKTTTTVALFMLALVGTVAFAPSAQAVCDISGLNCAEAEAQPCGPSCLEGKGEHVAYVGGQGWLRATTSGAVILTDSCIISPLAGQCFTSVYWSGYPGFDCINVRATTLPNVGAPVQDSAGACN